MFWTIAPNADLHWRSWEGEAVVFHPSSGDTHILHPLAAEVLMHLQDHNANTTELTHHIAQAFGLQNNEELSQQVELCLVEFAGLGLIIQTSDAY